MNFEEITAALAQSGVQPTYYEWNTQQLEALESLRDFLAGPPGVFVLGGYAGTGKTTLAVAELQTHAGVICFTAPTHKAVGVLANKGAVRGAEYATIHRLLGCKRQRRDGRTEFLPDFDRAAWHGQDIIVVDEVSMVGDTMWGWIQDAQATWPRHVICMGDPAQLPPVQDGVGLSPAFGRVDAQLTEVMRSAGIVFRASQRVREHLDSSTPVEIECGADELGAVEKMGRDDFLAAALQDFEARRDAKMLAWTNDAVNWLNSTIRRGLFGDDVDEAPQPGERLVVVSTWADSDESLMLHAEDEVYVADVEERFRFEIPAWRLRCVGLDVPLYVVRPEGAAQLKRAIQNARSEARRTGKWSRFYALQDAFIDLRPGYATTVHKSQGSTYETCYVVDRNLRQCHDASIRNMLRYVAFSRASKRLVIS